MKRFFSFKNRLILLVLLLLNIPFFLTWYIAKNQTESTVMQEKSAKLITLTKILDSHLGPDGFEGILKQHGAENAPREEKIKIINSALEPFSNSVGLSSSGLGVGYYSRDLDAIVTYAPSKNFGQSVGLTIPPDHPGRKVMATNQPMVKSGTMVRGDILNAMLPLERHGKVTGYVWANELSTDITSQMASMAKKTFFIMAICFGVTIVLFLSFTRRTVRDVDRIITGVRAMRFDLSQRIESSEGELGEVVASINAMAEDIDKANAETGRAISVLQSVMSNVEATVYVCDPATKTLVYTNDYLNKIMGGEDLQGKLCYAALQGKSAPCEFCPQQYLFDAQNNPIMAPMRWETRNPIIHRDFMVTDRLITWHDGRLLHMEVGTDVTERNALAVAEATNIAQRDFLARMSHELRTPMNGVLGMTHLAIQAGPPPAQLEYLKKIQSSASLLLGIINDILDFFRIEAGKLSVEKQSFNLHAIIANIRELILPRAEEKKLELIINVDESVPQFVSGDELRLSQVLLNLLGNASKFTLQGHVRLDVKAEPLPGGKLRLFCSVSDTGIGLTPDQLAGLFKPFTQADTSTSRKFGGTGLGLSISKALVELMGGHIQASSEEGRGSTFSFDIEIEPAEALSEAIGDNPAKNFHYNRKKVLLVEDNEINQEIANALLQDLGITATTAENGEKALEHFMRDDFDLILMDVRMPVMDGLEATRRIRSSGKHDAPTVPIIAMTANAMREDRDACEAAGMNSHIAKPIDVDNLKNVLFQYLGDQKTA